MHKWAEDRQRQFALGGRARRYSPAVQSPRNNGMSEVDALDALPQGHYDNSFYVMFSITYFVFPVLSQFQQPGRDRIALGVLILVIFASWQDAVRHSPQQRLKRV